MAVFTDKDKEALDILVGKRRGPDARRAVRFDELDALAAKLATAATGASVDSAVYGPPPVVAILTSERILNDHASWGSNIASIVVPRIPGIPIEIYLFLQLRAANTSGAGTLEVAFYRGGTIIQRMTAETPYFGGMMPVAMGWLDGEATGDRVTYAVRAKKAAPSITGGADNNVRISKLMFIARQGGRSQ